MYTENTIFDKARKIVHQILDIMLIRRAENTDDLQQWLLENPTSAETANMFGDAGLLEENLQNFCRPEKLEKSKLLMEKIRHRRVRRRVKQLSGAAAVLLLLLTFVLYQGKEEDSQGNDLRVHVKGPVLILANGKSFNLRMMHQDIELEDGMNIRFGKDNELAYIKDSTYHAVMENEHYNKLIIPEQCIYRLMLSDGTVVHVNAESELEYPEKFVGNERQVRLKGEAYFEVARNSRPFIVNSGKIRISAYGTKFNVNAYRKNVTETVLVEGKVGVALSREPGSEKILLPAQLSRIESETGKHFIMQVGTEKYVSWINGVLRYEDDPFAEVAEDLSRWYGVKLRMEQSDLEEMEITASINKDLPFEKVISMLQTTLGIKFLKEEGGNYVIVSEK